MSVIGLVSLAERLLNQGSQGQNLPTTQKGTNATAANETAGAAEDLFTPSAQSGQTQDAGLFSVAQFSFFSAAADFLLGQGNGPQTTATATSTPDAGGGNGATGQTNTAAGNLPGLATPQPIVNLGPLGTTATDGNAGNAVPAGGTATATTAGTNAAGPGNVGAGTLASQQQLQSLNTALVALGLTPPEIQQLDQIASILNDFDPTAYTSLAYQLEQLAQAQQPATTPAAGNAQNTAANTPNNAAPANAAPANAVNGNGNAFQIQELAIKFAGVQVQGGTANGAEAAAPGTAAAGNGTLQTTAFNLQIEELNLTLTNGTGQTAQVQLPQANANTPTAKARAAGA